MALFGLFGERLESNSPKARRIQGCSGRSGRPSSAFGTMATASKIGPQDLPPAGGYPPIQTERIRLRSFVGFKTGVALFVVTNVAGFIGYGMNYRRHRREVIEMRSAKFVLQPVLGAERDRAFLKQLRKNRDEEEDLMKDYPGWVVGTYFGEPIYHNLPEDTLVEPQSREYLAHADVMGVNLTRHFSNHVT